MKEKVQEVNKLIDKINKLERELEIFRFFVLHQDQIYFRERLDEN
jgi:hypothetical protein